MLRAVNLALVCRDNAAQDLNGCRLCRHMQHIRVSPTEGGGTPVSYAAAQQQGTEQEAVPFLFENMQDWLMQ